MRTVFFIFCSASMILGCSSRSDDGVDPADLEFVQHLFDSEAFYTEYSNAQKEEAERLLADFLRINEEYLDSGDTENRSYYLGNIVLTKARLGLIQAAEGNLPALETYLNEALPAYIEILEEQLTDKTNQDLKREILVWVLALDMDEVPWLSRDVVVSLGLADEIKEVDTVRNQSDRFESSYEIQTQQR